MNACGKRGGNNCAVLVSSTLRVLAYLLTNLSQPTKSTVRNVYSAAGREGNAVRRTLVTVARVIARLPPFSPIPTRIGEVHRKLNFSET
jgi:hypothetical protein